MIMPVCCCYCGETHLCPEIPCLVKCEACGHEYRVLINASGALPIDLTSEAKGFYAKDSGSYIG